MNLVDCLSELSKLKRHNGTDASVLDRIYEIIATDQSQLPTLIGLIPNQNRATIRALWRYTEEMLSEKYSFEDQKEIIYKAFIQSEEKLPTVNLVLGRVPTVVRGLGGALEQSSQFGHALGCRKRENNRCNA